MSNLFGRFKEITQSGEGYLPPSKAKAEPFRNGSREILLGDIDRVLLSLAVSSLVKVEMDVDDEVAFADALWGADSVGEKDEAEKLLSDIGPLSEDKTISAAIYLSRYALYARCGKGSLLLKDDIKISDDDLSSVRSIVFEAKKFLESKGIRDAATPLLRLGVDEVIDSTRGSPYFIGGHGLYQLAITDGLPTKEQTLEPYILYCLLEKNGKYDDLIENVNEVGVYDLRSGTSYVFTITELGDDVFPNVHKNVIDFSAKEKADSKGKLTAHGDKAYFSIECEIPSAYSYLEYHTDQIAKTSRKEIYVTSFSLIGKMVLDNHTDRTFERVIIRFSFSDPMFKANDLIVENVGSLRKKKVESDPGLSFDGKALYEINGTKAVTIKVTCLDGNSHQELDSLTRTVRILPFEQASESRSFAMPLFAKYAVTGFPSLVALHQKAIEENGNKSLIGYQNGGPKGVIEEVRAIYNAIHKWGINYANPPASEGRIQRVRLPNVVLRDRLATCLDSSILFCSALLDAGIDPILIIIYGHALVGFFLDPGQRLSDIELHSVSELYEAVSGNHQRVVVFDTVAAAAQSSKSFADAIRDGEEELRGYRGEFSALDVKFLQDYIFKPIPIPRDDGSIDFAIKPEIIKEKDLQKLRDYQIRDIQRGKEDRFDYWKRNLLDLTTANRLISFHFSASRSNYAAILGLTSGEIYNLLKKNESGVVKVSTASMGRLDIGGGDLPSHDCAVTNESSVRHGKNLAKEGKLLALSSKKDLKRIMETDRSRREETGSPTLYLALGALRTLYGRGTVNAPFLLLPITLSKDRLDDDYTMRYDFDELMVNQTFLEFLKAKKGADYTNLYGIDPSFNYEDISGNLMRNHSADVTLDEDSSWIANFTFAHYVMWRDMMDREPELRDNVVVRSLIENRSLIQNTDLIGEKDADEIDDMTSFVAPLPYDSTQLRAIVCCAAGNSFVLDGPPGTGKSQTIVNMIVNAIFHGKSVLFVAEKQAALEVVRERLSRLKFNEQYGLDTFCLQLYSGAANKKDFFRRVGRAMELPPFKEPAAFVSNGEQARARRSELAEELADLHENHGRFYSLFQAFSNAIDNEKFKDVYLFPSELVPYYDESKDRSIRQAIFDLVTLFKGQKNYLSSPGRLLHMTRFGPDLQRTLPSDLASLRLAYGEANDARSAFLKALGGNPLPTLASMRQDIELFELLFSPDASLVSFDDCDFLKDEAGFADFSAKLARFQEIEKQLDSFFIKEKRENLPYEETAAALEQSSSFFKRIFFGRKPFQLVAPFLKPGAKPKRNDLETFVPLFKERSELINAMIPHLEEAERLSGFGVLGRGFDIERLNRRFAVTAKAFDQSMKDERAAALSEACRGKKGAVLQTCLSSFERFREKADAFEQLFSKCSDLYGLKADELDVEDFGKAIASLRDYFQGSKVEEGYDIAHINACGSTLAGLGLASFFKLATSGTLSPDDLPGVYESGLDQAFIEYHFKNDEYPSSFSSSLYETKVREYQSLIEEFRLLSIAEAVGCLSKNFLEKSVSYSDENPIGQLRKLIRNGGRGMSIRNALSKFGDYIRSYFPCFLMSPLAAAQYLSINNKKFDIVIFDEASQIPTSEAVGPIARGNSLIVAGDPEQMPPSNYFSSLVAPDEDEEDAVANMDAESLLDDCLAIGLPRLRLAFHYRSRHESLISFSNANFYGNGLFTFPSPDIYGKHVQFIYVETDVSKKTNNLSDQERDEILKLLDKLLSDPAYEGKSIGIIVFNIRQQEKLVDALDSFFEKNPDLEKKAHWGEVDSENRLFVKNLESVQGDERDIIIMSVGFSKGKDGRARIGGPITLDRGERRLNVACSRSKEEMFVVSTIKHTDIDLTNRKNDGVKFLRDFLLYAEEQSGESHVSEHDAPSTSLARMLGKVLEEKGFAVDFAIGKSEFKVDLAVSKKKGEPYILGIILDSAPLSHNTSCRDRFYVEPTVLSGLKWRIVRIYTYELITARTSCINRLLEALENTSSPSEAETQPSTSERPTPVLEPVEEKTPDFISTFRSAYPAHRREYSAVDPSRPYDPDLKSEIERLIEIEGPVSRSRLKEFIKDYYGIDRAGNRVEGIVDYYGSLLARDNRATFDYDREAFFWSVNAGSPKTVLFFHVGNGRDLMDISKEEIATLLLGIVASHRIISRHDLEDEAIEYLGTSKLTDRVKRKLDFVIDYMIENGLMGNNFVEEYSQN